MLRLFSILILYLNNGWLSTLFYANSQESSAAARWVRSILDIIGDRLAAIHCKDYYLNEDGTKVGNIPALTGCFRWKAFAEELHRRKIDVPWLLENLNPKTVQNTTVTLEKY